MWSQKLWPFIFLCAIEMTALAAESVVSGGPCLNLDLSVPYTQVTFGLNDLYTLRMRLNHSYREQPDQSDVNQALMEATASERNTRRDAVAKLTNLHSQVDYKLRPSIVQGLLTAWETERDPQVFVLYLYALKEMKATREAAPYLARLFLCNCDPALRKDILYIASELPYPSFVAPLITAWGQTQDEAIREYILHDLAVLKDHRAFAIAFRTFKESGSQTSISALHKIASNQDFSKILEVYRMRKGWPVPTQIEILKLLSGICGKDNRPSLQKELLNIVAVYRDESRWSTANRNEILKIVAALGTPEALPILKTEYHREQPPMRRDIAKLVLQAQLESDKPPFPLCNGYKCMPTEDILHKRLPYIRREVERLLRPENHEFFKLAGWDDDVYGTFNEWSQSLYQPADRVAFWREVLQIPIPDEMMSLQPKRELVLALAQLSAAELKTDPAAAVNHVDEALSLTPELHMSSVFEGLKDLKRRIIRSTKPVASKMTLAEIAGEYHQSNGFSWHRLVLNADGTYDDFAGSDASSGRNTHGNAYWEGQYLILDPGILRLPGMPDALMPVRWGQRSYLLIDNEEMIKVFVNEVNSGQMSGAPEKLWSAYLLRIEGEGKVAGQPKTPDEWAPYFLKDSVETNVRATEDESRIILDAGADQGLLPGMVVYSKRKGVCKIESVDARSSQCVPSNGTIQSFVIGTVVSTRAPAFTSPDQ